MLGHGAGRFTAYIDPLVLTLAIPALLFGFAAALWAARLFKGSVVICSSAVVLAAFGGLFGYTTLSIGLIPALALWRFLFTRRARDLRLASNSSGPPPAAIRS
jgi:hypothetical protein